MIKRPNRSTLCLAESNGIEPSSLAQWDGFQDRLSTMLPTLQLLWLPVLISGLAPRLLTALQCVNSPRVSLGHFFPRISLRINHNEKSTV
ncbi:hypothetical protein E8L53_22525 [Escherichia coli]|nr:hypothetical protein [Escherichia coli]